MNIKGSKHLSLSDRMYIQAALADGRPLKETAEGIKKDERTVSKEVRKRRTKSFSERSKLKDQSRIPACKRLARWPFVCNGCRRKQTCFLAERYSYDAKAAQADYESALSQCREGVNMTMEEKVAFDSALMAGVGKGQSIHAIAATSDAIKCSERTVYRLVDAGKTVVQNIDLIRKVKLKKRKGKGPKAPSVPIPDGAEYQDFIRYMEENPGSIVAQLDTVMPGQGYSRCLMTVHFPAAHFMIAVPLEAKTQEEVSKAFRSLKGQFGKELYSKLFRVVLTDRGAEFRNTREIEFWDDGEKVSSVFYCDAYCSWQKGAIEENHRLIRAIRHKSESMDDITPEKAVLMMSHINSYVRRSLRGKAPYDVMCSLVGEDAVRKTGIVRIDPGDITLKPELLR